MCLGCGAQEEFYGCADIAIANSTQRPRSSVNQIHATQIPITRTHRTNGSPTQTTAVVYPLQVQGDSPAETTTLAGPVLKLGDGSQVVGPETTTAASASLLPTKQVIQFAGQPYDVVIHSSVLFSFLFSLLCYLIAGVKPTGL